MPAVAGLMGRKRPHLRRRAAFLLGNLLAAGLFFTVTIGFLGVGLYLALAVYVSPVSAALLVALTGAALAALSVGIVVIAARRTQKALRRTVETGALAVLAPPVLAFAVRHSGILASAALAGLAFVAIRRRGSSE